MPILRASGGAMRRVRRMVLSYPHMDDVRVLNGPPKPVEQDRGRGRGSPGQGPANRSRAGSGHSAAICRGGRSRGFTASRGRCRGPERTRRSLALALREQHQQAVAQHGQCEHGQELHIDDPGPGRNPPSRARQR